MKTADKLGAFIVVLAVIWVFTSCKCNKSFVSTNTKIDTEFSKKKDITVTSEEKTLKNELNTETKSVLEDESIFLFKTEYDTDKPVNPETGKPPVKSETVFGKKKETKENTESEQNVTESGQKNMNFEDKGTVDEKNNTEEKVKQESPKDPYRFRYIFYTVAVLSVVLIYFNRSKIFSFVKKMLKL